MKVQNHPGRYIGLSNGKKGGGGGNNERRREGAAVIADQDSTKNKRAVVRGSERGEQGGKNRNRPNRTGGKLR